MQSTIVFYEKFDSDLGTIHIVADDKGLHSVSFFKPGEFEERPSEITSHAKNELIAYFSGDLREFSVDLYDPSGTEFQKSVWKVLMSIPYGETRTYQQVANALDNPKAVRAVAGDIGANPISIIRPCHRVIGSDGSLTGYAGGLDRKEKLLRLEGVM